jgi:hypothetical protein
MVVLLEQFQQLLHNSSKKYAKTLRSPRHYSQVYEPFQKRRGNKKRCNHAKTIQAQKHAKKSVFFK